jgi:peptidoglycan/LPS O-acetylase OafA/YrhL
MQTAAARELTAVGIATLVVLAVLVLVVWSSDRAHLTAPSRAWRWMNLLTAGLVIVLAIDLLPDLSEETEWTHRADEMAIELLAGLAIVWFGFRRHRLARSLVPLAIVGLVVVVKLVAIPVEWSDNADVQGDIVLAAIGVPVLIALGLVYVRAWRRWAAVPDETAVDLPP